MLLLGGAFLVFCHLLLYMVHKPLPDALVRNLSRIAQSKHEQAVLRRFLRLKNVDLRVSKEDEMRFQQLINNTSYKKTHFRFEDALQKHGLRVRELNISKKDPFLRKVVIKASHAIFGQSVNSYEAVDLIFERVESANAFAQKNKSKWRVNKPFLYPLSEKFIAMAKTDFASTDSFLHKLHSNKIFCKIFELKNHISVTEFEKIVSSVTIALDTPPRNVLFVGKKKGKFVFVPLADLF